MLNKEVAKLLNEQICKELYSSYLYLDMANYYNDEGLEGFENWFYVQAQEEMDHAMLIRTYMLNNDENISLLPIDAPNKTYSDFSHPLKLSLEHEQFVTASINNIYSAAMAAKEFKTTQFLDWFIKEQVEEEKNSTDLIKKYDLFGNDAKALYQLDQELAARVYVAPTLVLD